MTGPVRAFETLEELIYAEVHFDGAITHGEEIWTHRAEFERIVATAKLAFAPRAERPALDKDANGWSVIRRALAYVIPREQGDDYDSWSAKIDGIAAYVEQALTASPLPSDGGGTLERELFTTRIERNDALSLLREVTADPKPEEMAEVENDYNTCQRDNWGTHLMLFALIRNFLQRRRAASYPSERGTSK